MVKIKGNGQPKVKQGAHPTDSHYNILLLHTINGSIHN